MDDADSKDHPSVLEGGPPAAQDGAARLACSSSNREGIQGRKCNQDGQRA